MTQKDCNSLVNLLLRKSMNQIFMFLLNKANFEHILVKIITSLDEFY